MWDGVYAGEAILKIILLWRESQSLYTLNYCIDLRVTSSDWVVNSHCCSINGSRLCLIFLLIRINYFSQSIMLRDLCQIMPSILSWSNSKGDASQNSACNEDNPVWGINPGEAIIIYCWPSQTQFILAPARLGLMWLQWSRNLPRDVILLLVCYFSREEFTVSSTVLTSQVSKSV